MRPEIHRLVQAVRELEIEPTGQPAPHCVRIGIAKEQLPQRLLMLRQTLDEVDAGGSLVLGNAESEDLTKLKDALDGLLRYIKMRGLDFTEAEEIVRTALGKPRKRQEAMKLLPVFAPNGHKRRKKIKPKLRLEREPMSAGKAKQEAAQMTWVLTSLGAAAPQAAPPEATTSARS
ncbi:hypothetical protein ACVIGB_000073 [Bradyrhizobium sp. USDA 4341]